MFRFLVFSVFVLIAVEAQSAVPGYGGDPCPPLPEPQVTVTSFFEPPTYNFNHTMSALRSISEREPANVLKKEQPVGLAIGELNIGITLKTNMIVGTDGQVCARPAQLTLDTGFQHNAVYVASELPRRSCGHEEVLAHEEGHLAIDRRLLQDFKPLLIRFAETAVQQLGTVRAATPDEAERKMQMFLNDQLQAASEPLRRERTARQSAHDSEEEYKRIGQVCNGAIAAAVTQYLTQTAQQSSGQTNAARLPAPARVPTRQPFTRY